MSSDDLETWFGIAVLVLSFPFALLYVVGRVLLWLAPHVPDDEDGALIAPRTGPGRWPSDLTQKGLPR